MGKESININFNWLGLLQLVLVCLKAFGKLDWSWWLVFAPTILGVGFSLLIVLTILVVGIISLRD